MTNWRSLKVGDKLTYTASEFGITASYEVKVRYIYEDHAIAIGNGMDLWIDDDTAYMFN